MAGMRLKKCARLCVSVEMKPMVALAPTLRTYGDKATRENQYTTEKRQNKLK